MLEVRMYREVQGSNERQVEEEEVGKDWENLKTAVEEAIETKKIVLWK